MQLLRGRTAGITELAVSPDSRYVAAGGLGCDVWDLHAARHRPVRLRLDTVHRVSFCTPSMLLVGADWPTVWSAWSIHHLATGVRTAVGCQAVRGSTVCVAARVADGLLKVATKQWDIDENGQSDVEEARLATGRAAGGVFEAVAGPRDLPIALRPLAFHPGGERYLAWGEEGLGYRLYDAATDELAVRLAVHPAHYAWNTAFSPDGSRLFLVHRYGIDGHDCAAGGKPVVSMEWPEPRDFGELALHPAGRLAATAEGAGGVTFRDAATLEVRRVYDFKMPKVNAVAFTPDGTRCVIGNSRGKVLIFDVDD